MENNIFVPQTQTLTKDQLIQNGINSIATLTSRNSDILKQTLEGIFEKVYGSQDYTCQDIFDALGTNAVQLFTAAQAVIALLAIVNPSYTPPAPPVPVTVNPDGTVTATLTPPQS